VSGTAIAAVAPRRRTRVRGNVVSVASYERPWVRADAEITDGSGSSALRFWVALRSRALSWGCRIEAEGLSRNRPRVVVMINPLYSFTRVG
jgi:hypothetical protein